MTVTIDRMAKTTGKGGDRPAKEVLYLEVDSTLKRRLRRLADMPHRNRKITAEATIALSRYVEEEEEKEGLSPIDEPAGKPKKRGDS
jgi:hypothetical protein